MECKEVSTAVKSIAIVVLIETLWNVKMVKISNCGHDENVLIETLWNVKSCIRCYNVLRCIVLIETLWNVKILMNMLNEGQISY